MLRLALAIAVAGLRLIYVPLRFRRRQDLLLLISRQYSSTSDDFQRIADESQRVSPRTKVVILNHRSTRNLVIETGRLLKQMWYIAVARAVIVDTYIIPISVLPPIPDRPVIQIWHAIGAIKKFGMLSIGTDEGASTSVARGMHMHQGYSMVACGGEWAQETLAAGFGVPLEQVKSTGQPRHDALVDTVAEGAGRARIQAAYPEVLDGRPIILYAPTMRRGEELDLFDLRKALSGLDAHIVVSLHPLDNLTTVPSGFVNGHEVSTNDWLAVTDHLITDYSAIGLEAAVLGIPVWFYVFDIEDYRKSPGLLIDPLIDLPEISASNRKELRVLLQSALTTSPSQSIKARWKSLSEGFGTCIDGHATRRILAECGLLDEQDSSSSSETR